MYTHIHIYIYIYIHTHLYPSASPPWPLRVSPGFTDLKPQAEDPMLGGFQDLIIMMMMIMIIMIIIFIMINYC